MRASFLLGFLCIAIPLISVLNVWTFYLAMFGIGACFYGMIMECAEKGW